MQDPIAWPCLGLSKGWSRHSYTNARSKSIDIKYHYVRGTVSSQNIRFKFVPTTEQQADLLTKSLPSPAVMRFTDLVFGIAHFACVSCAHGLI